MPPYRFNESAWKQVDFEATVFAGSDAFTIGTRAAWCVSARLGAEPFVDLAAVRGLRAGHPRPRPRQDRGAPPMNLDHAATPKRTIPQNRASRPPGDATQLGPESSGSK